jgi:hypothetical protein
MDLAEIKSMTSLLGSFSFGAAIGAAAVYLLLKSFLPSYLSEKGKNLATKEDIASITDKVESVKTDYAKVLEELRSDNQLKLAEIERERNLKKEVYLQATEAITRSQTIVSRLSDLNVGIEELSRELVSDSGVIAKVQIVGSELTVKAVTTLMASIGTSILELMLERRALDGRKDTIERLNNFRSARQSEIDRYIAIKKNLNVEGNQDQRLWDTLNKAIEFEVQQHDQVSAEINDLWNVQNKDHLKFSQKCMERFFEVSSLMPEAVLAVRAELNLPISDGAYLDICNQSTQKGKEVFSDFIRKVSGNQA